MPRQRSLNGYTRTELLEYVEPLPAQIPERTIAPLRTVDKIEPHAAALWADDDYRKMAGSVTADDSFCGHPDGDKWFAAQKLKARADEDGDPNMHNVSMAQIKKTLQSSLRRRGQSRTQRLKAAEQRLIESRRTTDNSQ